MTAQATQPVLNNLLNRMTHSLLQYMGESWPWDPSEDHHREQLVAGLVRRQQFGASRIAELMQKRRELIELDNYPEDRSELHYVSLDYFKPLLIQDQQSLVDAVQSAIHDVQASGDDEAARLLEQLVSEESQTLDELKAL